MNISMRQKQRDRQRRWVREERIGSLELADANYYLLNNKFLLYSMGNATQSPGTNNNGRFFLMNVCTCITDSFCCTAKVNTLSTILQ